ncbi:grasp-with-spasm system ATP-grasp peptide maturase [Psychroserpens algicola]|uniref:grasp-with-spasm system ATP-grasp peptide maturase n=1 Tax=Psychroserpens algicola TaxID=1719034 RepID=UPI0019535ABD|nr:grasp-with-spasm system ATP-grasp peptide maturase [Psychroserpens algicola]
MILILSLTNDYSTGEVIKWLNFLNKPFVRINEDDEITLEYLDHQDLRFDFKGEKINLSDITAIWYRRGNFNINALPFKLKDKKPLLQAYVGSEITELTHYIHNLFKTKKNLNNYNTHHVNKLEVLRFCKDNDINHTPFIVTQSKSDLQSFYEKEKNIISKAIKSPFIVLTKELHYGSYTYKVKSEDIDNLPENFTPTFFQKQIDKKYEIRTFYIDGDFYSMAIFSQGNDQTKLDFRHYDEKHPNRTLPFKLPKEYEAKLDKMLRHFDVNCASMDTIISPDNEYSMIDINPIGQFGMTSMPCNYNLEKTIAEYLTDER